ncbi:MAG: GHMP kinase [Brevinema sp.]
MIISRTPFRISFVGGGSDFADYYREYGGAVISTSIQKYMYLSMHPHFESESFLLKYSKIEDILNYEEIKHPILREVLKLYSIKGIEFHANADIPSGTGLSSSSAFTAGLITLCNAYTEKFMTQENIAQLACHIEIELLKDPIGKQDQYACACGGLNHIEFHPDETVSVSPLILPKTRLLQLENNLMLFYTGVTRSAGSILQEQKENIQTKLHNLHKIVKLVADLKYELLSGNIDSMGELLHTNWMYKKELASGISNPIVEESYTSALKHGASGGKLLGAGGGGFLLFYVVEKNQAAVRKALHNLREVPFSFDTMGTTLIHYS